MTTALKRRAKRLLLASLLVLAASGAQPLAAAGATPLYSSEATGPELRFGATIGSGLGWTPPASRPGASIGFGGRAALSCSGLDYAGFLQGFNAEDYIKELRDQFLSGAQSAALTYLMVTAYSDPTLASVFDMLNQSYSARFGLFQSACNAQEARERGLEQGARRMAQAQNQCYEERVRAGASPTQAYQSCANEATFGGIAERLPAGKSTIEFLQHYTSLNITKEFEALLGLLPDERVSASGYEMRPPRLTLHQLNRNLEGRTGNAIELVLNGTAPSSLRECKAQDALDPPREPTEACLPPAVAGIVHSPAFLAARQLSPEARRLYRDALSGQLTIAALRASILDLMTQVSQMDVREGAGAHASEVSARKRALEEQIALVQRDADALQALQQAKANAIRTQILALDLVNQSIARVEQAKPPARTNRFAFDAFRAVFGFGEK